MKLTLTLLSVLLAAPSSILSKPVSSNALVPLAPRTNKYRGHYNPGGPRHHAFPQHHHRRKVHLRASRNETDDVADEFLAALSEANCGGTLVLEKGKTYVLGKKLDLTFLDDIVVQLDGQILVGYFFALVFKFGGRGRFAAASGNYIWGLVHEVYGDLAFGSILAIASSLVLPAFPDTFQITAAEPKTPLIRCY